VVVAIGLSVFAFWFETTLMLHVAPSTELSADAQVRPLPTPVCAYGDPQTLPPTCMSSCPDGSGDHCTLDALTRLSHDALVEACGDTPQFNRDICADIATRVALGTPSPSASRGAP